MAVLNVPTGGIVNPPPLAREKPELMPVNLQVRNRRQVKGTRLAAGAIYKHRSVERCGYRQNACAIISIATDPKTLLVLFCPFTPRPPVQPYTLSL
jgi:hypothetical protein